MSPVGRWAVGGGGGPPPGGLTGPVRVGGSGGYPPPGGSRTFVSILSFFSTGPATSTLALVTLV